MSCRDSVAEKTPHKGNFREKGFAPSHSSKASSVLVGTAKQQECEAAGHITSTVRTREGCVHVAGQLPLSIYTGQGSVFLGNGAAHSGWAFPPPPSEDNPPRSAQRAISQVILEVLKLTAEI